MMIMKTKSYITFFLALLISLPAATVLAEPLAKDKMVDILKGIDLRIRSSGDYKALFYLEQKRKR